MQVNGTTETDGIIGKAPQVRKTKSFKCPQQDNRLLLS